MKPLTPKEKTKDAYLRRTYHITLEEYNAVLKHQQGRCAICKRKPTDFKAGRAFAVDHCHTTGLLRGLLCWNCNKILAASRDDEAKLAAAALYIAQPPMVVWFGESRFTVPGEVGTKKRAKLLAKLREIKSGV